MIGASLGELAVVLLITGLVAAALAGLLHGHERLARTSAEHLARTETVRIAGAVIGAELRWLAPDRDIHAAAGDSVAIRALRAFAMACGGNGSATYARYRGLREPDPDKDSVVVLRPSGRETVFPLDGAAPEPDACATTGGEEVYRLVLPEPVPPGTPLLFYESGSYHLTDNALRYRRGAAGRQPLTPELLDPERTRIALHGAPPGTDAPVILEVDLAVAPTPHPGRRAGPGVTRIRLPLPNRPAGSAAEPGGLP